MQDPQNSKQVESIDLDLHRGEATWDDYIQKAQQLREEQDNIQWGIGDLAVDVTDTFGPKTLKDFARDSGIPITTVRRYRDVARAYSPLIRKQYSFLPWSTFKALAGQENRLELLLRANDEGWTSEKAGEMVKKTAIDDGLPVPPKPEMLLCQGCRRWVVVDPTQLCPSAGQCIDIGK